MNDPLNIEQIDLPSVTSNDILFLGCSYTSAVGVENNQRYSYLMSKSMQKNEINLSSAGKGNYRSFDLFGQLNIFQNATVVLQLTELARIRWYNDSINDIMLSNDPIRPLLFSYHDKFCIYDTIRQLRILVNYCRVKKIKLIMWSIARFNNEFLDNTFEHYLSRFPEYVYLDNSLDGTDSYRVDNGTDGNLTLGTGHPGPKSHERIADFLLKHYKKLY